MSTTELQRALDARRKSDQVTLPASGVEGLDEHLMSCAIWVMNKTYGHDLKGVRINKRTRKRWVNIFVLRIHPDGPLRRFLGSCAYTGDNNIIVADASYIESTLQAPPIGWERGIDAVDAGAFEEVRALGEAMFATLWSWLLLHEMGHIAHGHLRRHVHFEGDTRLLIPPALGSGSDSSAMQLEMEADAFVLDVLEQAGPTAALVCRNAIDQAIAREGVRLRKAGRLKGDLYKGSSPIAVPVGQTASHPPMFWRAVSLAAAINDRFGFEQPNQARKVLDRIRLHVEA